MIIGLTGRIASGKGVLAKYLQKKGFSYLSLSQIVHEEARKRNIELTRKNLQDLGNELRIKHGPGILAKRIIKLIDDGNFVIDGIRNHLEVLEFRNLKDFKLISLDAPKKLRYKRVLSRARESDPETWEEFLIIDERDFGEEQEEGQQVCKCMELADIKLVSNYPDLTTFNKELDKLFEELLC